MSNLLRIVAEALWGPWTFYTILILGIIATVGTKFVQVRILTHGFAVITGKYDDPNDPGALNHFQALAAALSARTLAPRSLPAGVPVVRIIWVTPSSSTAVAMAKVASWFSSLSCFARPSLALPTMETPSKPAL